MKRGNRKIIEDAILYDLEGINTDVKAVAMSIRGKEHEPDGRCEDSSIVCTSESGRHTVLVAADGHSSVRFGREGADLICSVFPEIIQDLDEKGFSERDLIRFFRSREGMRHILDSWKDAVIKDAPGRGLSVEDEKRVIHEYGATLNAAVLTDHYIIGCSVGDGALILIKKDGTSDRINDDGESGISVRYTFSLSDLDTEYMNVFVGYRDDYKAVIAASDGITKTGYEITGEASISEEIERIYTSSGSWEVTCSEIQSFMLGEVKELSGDDATLVYAILREREDDEFKDRFFANIGRRALYDVFKKRFPQIGVESAGIYNILGKAGVLRSALVLCDEVENMNSVQAPISNPTGEAFVFRYDLKTDEGMVELDKELMMKSTQEHPDEIRYNREMYPELCCYVEEGANAVVRNNAWLTGLLYLFLEREGDYQFRTADLWASGEEPRRKADTTPRIFDEETIQYMKKVLSRSLAADQWWTPETWRKKLDHWLKEEQKKQETILEENPAGNLPGNNSSADREQARPEKWGFVSRSNRPKEAFEICTEETGCSWKQFQIDREGLCFTIRVFTDRTKIAVIFDMNQKVEIISPKERESEILGIRNRKDGTPVLRILISYGEDTPVRFLVDGVEFLMSKYPEESRKVPDTDEKPEQEEMTAPQWYQKKELNQKRKMSRKERIRKKRSRKRNRRNNRKTQRRS